MNIPRDPNEQRKLMNTISEQEVVSIDDIVESSASKLLIFIKKYHLLTEGGYNVQQMGVYKVQQVRVYKVSLFSGSGSGCLFPEVRICIFRGNASL